MDKSGVKQRQGKENKIKGKGKNGEERGKRRGKRSEGNGQT